jgi:hypothetical protein
LQRSARERAVEHSALERTASLIHRAQTWNSDLFNFVLRFIPFSCLAWSTLAFAQEPAAPGPNQGDDDDLELPVGAGAGAAQPAKGAPPATSDKASPAAAPVLSEKASADPAALRRELDQLRARLLQLEQAQKPATSTPSPTPQLPSGLKLSGYLQAQLEVNQLSEDQLQQGGAPLNQDRFVLRRGRIRFDQTWQYAGATLELDANTVRGVSVGVRRAEGAVFYRGSNAAELPPLVMLSFGVTDLPFGHELLESTRTRYFMERSQTSLALFPTEMDVGVKLSGAVGLVRYAFAVANGEPVDNLAGRLPRDPNSAKDVTGRVGVDFKPISSLRVVGGSSFSRGTGFHPGVGATKAGFIWSDDNEDGKLQSSEIIGIAGSAASPSRNFSRWAYGLDLALEVATPIGATKLYGEAYLASSYDRGLYIADPVQGGSDVREAGGYLALVQGITPYGVVGFRYSVYDPNSDFFDQRQGKQIPSSARVVTLSPLVGVQLPAQARLLFQYDFTRDKLARDAVGVPTDAKNNLATLRLQVEL